MTAPGGTGQHPYLGGAVRHTLSRHTLSLTSSRLEGSATSCISPRLLIGRDDQAGFSDFVYLLPRDVRTRARFRSYIPHSRARHDVLLLVFIVLPYFRDLEVGRLSWSSVKRRMTQTWRRRFLITLVTLYVIDTGSPKRQIAQDCDYDLIQTILTISLIRRVKYTSSPPKSIFVGFAGIVMRWLINRFSCRYQKTRLNQSRKQSCKRQMESLFWKLLSHVITYLYEKRIFCERYLIFDSNPSFDLISRHHDRGSYDVRCEYTTQRNVVFNCVSMRDVLCVRQRHAWLHIYFLRQVEIKFRIICLSTEYWQIS